MQKESAIVQIDNALLGAQTDYEEITRILKPFDMNKEGLEQINENLLFHGDNIDILTGLRRSERFSMIYIDPPFNTDSDFAYIDKFQDSTWLTLMENRLNLAKEFLENL